MRNRFTGKAAAAVVLAILAGCASKPPAAATDPDKVTVHESVASAPVRYEVVTRLWIESWRSALRVPAYGSVEQGAADFRQQAASRGGNGVINFGCYPTAPGSSAFHCNGTVVKFQ